ncbi:MAG: hypothetical protein R3281_17900, partial [Balneolaceae bacterium]|nr:hypothetical protein [Balneolaceae bacterium]
AGLPAAARQDTVAEDQDQMLIGLLDSSLGSLSETNRRGRMVGGYVLLGLGIGTGLGGAATLAFGEGDDARIVGYSLIGGGVVLSGLSLIPFRVKSETERFYEEFRSMPANTQRRSIANTSTGTAASRNWQPRDVMSVLLAV